MPTCPGCEQHISYERLDTHQRYCADLRSEDRLGGASLERLDRQISEMEESLDRRVRQLEIKLEKQVRGSDSRKQRKQWTTE